MGDCQPICSTRDDFTNRIRSECQQALATPAPPAPSRSWCTVRASRRLPTSVSLHRLQRSAPAGHPDCQAHAPGVSRVSLTQTGGSRHAVHASTNLRHRKAEHRLVIGPCTGYPDQFPNTAFLSVSLIRDCQPLPLLRKWAAKSASSLMI